MIAPPTKYIRYIHTYIYTVYLYECICIYNMFPLRFPVASTSMNLAYSVDVVVDHPNWPEAFQTR